MNNILISVKKFFQNKNIVTVIGVLLILGLLYFGYSSTIKSEVNPINMPVAATTIQPRTEITDSLITYVKIPNKAITSNVYRYSSHIIGKYTDVNTVIPQGSMFYSNVIVEKSQLPDSAFVAVKEGERPYALAVTTQTTYGNSIFPGNVVDIYMKAVNEENQVMIGRLLEKVEVLAVKDSSGNNVFEDTSVNRSPATLLFGAPDYEFTLLKAAEYLKSKGVELFPVPYGGTAPIEGLLLVDREELVSYIENNSELLVNSKDNKPVPDDNEGVLE